MEALAAPSPRAGLFRRRAPAPPRGLYLHGPVGRGKTMLMDLLFEASPEPGRRRAHFHAFMADVHARVQAVREELRRSGDRADPLPPVADAIAAETRLLCLDEVIVDDIANAMILDRLFGRLFDAGLVLVATSNAAPDELYRGGLNRELFLPFIARLKQQTEVVELMARTDYRLEKMLRSPVFVIGEGPAAHRELDRLWHDLTGLPAGARARPATLAVLGRTLAIPEATKGAARFAFADLCEAPLGSPDYLALADTYRTLAVGGVPRFTADRRDAAKRFVTLIDTLYDRRTRLIMSVAAEPDRLFAADAAIPANDIARTVSRLEEMRSAGWASAPRLPTEPART